MMPQNVVSLPLNAVDNVISIDAKAWKRYLQVAQQAVQQQDLIRAEQAFILAASEAEKAQVELEVRAGIFNQMTGFYFQNHNLARAEASCQRALEIFSDLHGIEHPASANCLNTLAGIYYRQSRYSEAEALCAGAIAVFERTLGPDHADVGVAANNMALVYHAQNKYEEAKQSYERALKIRCRVLGSEHPAVVALKDSYVKLMAAQPADEDATVQVKGAQAC